MVTLGSARQHIYDTGGVLRNVVRRDPKTHIQPTAEHIRQLKYNVDQCRVLVLGSKEAIVFILRMFPFASLEYCVALMLYQYLNFDEIAIVRDAIFIRYNTRCYKIYDQRLVRIVSALFDYWWDSV
ncbi:hypothetical protein COT97_04470 [Candidatus Falkowbacteria bacterium CG10_big_fil_rev_8_21_14_0_10_39_11]|uniref:Uncharacterized protein n=1 Tax=Candidatus Falkowbacteria bacterium CG10_big_fil_rev_8_21_14_0_10_39_11 TaxID=1974565 RepID=A0A2H0V448_9BACT|nr:MAG: hypothetical protein COT97_04470 [Candidatus Falkowbacteria bacterium CG10_big_fil_rev_8_21_14_0_10_39_11]